MSVVRSLIVKVGADTKEFQTKMKNLSKDLKSTGKDLSSAGASLTKGLTVPLIGAAAGLTGLAIKAGQGADELITLSNKTGISTQSLQELEYAARFVDVEVSTMTDSMFKMTQRMDDAKKGTGAQAEAFKKLNVSVVDQNGNLRNAKQVWIEAIGALGKVSNEAERDAVAYEIFGRSAQELNPLIAAGAEELERLQKEAHDVGAVMSDDTVKALGKFDDMMQKLKAVVKTTTAELGAAFLPVLESLEPIIVNTIIPAIKGLSEKLSALLKWYSDLSPAMRKFILTLLGIAVAIGPVLSTVGKLTTSIGGIVGTVGKMSKAVQGGAGILKAFGLVLSPGGAIMLAVLAFAGAAYLIIKNWDKVSEFFSNLKKKILGVFGVLEEGSQKTYSAPKITSEYGGTSGGVSGSSGGGTRGVSSARVSGSGAKPATTLINVTGNTILGDRDADRLGDTLVKRLKLAGVRV